MIIIYKIYKYLTGNRPIYHLITSNDNSKHIIIKENVKFKTTPIIDDSIYFNEKGPYYRVIGITHHMSTFHVIWVSVEKIL